VGEPLKCGGCGIVIGYYEPLVLLLQGQARTTSVAAEPQVRDSSGEHFHRGCYAEPQSGSRPHG
jgi:hypothetical protein